MAENFGNGFCDKFSQPLVQTDILEEDLPSRVEAQMKLSGEYWGQVGHEAFSKVKQIEKLSEGQKILEEMPGKRVEISDCGFGEGIASTKRQNEIQESMRRIRQIDLKPYLWNTPDIRA